MPPEAQRMNEEQAAALVTAQTRQADALEAIVKILERLAGVVH